ncbi:MULTISPECIES: ABC transporter ATP-binding protein [Streptomyces]|uniref:ABC-2 type transport system ATP-binding protein n=1 Tax=Streptomyces misionensis TaxID=67331 RepID=A0A1H5BCH8_9ACTN|nr:MULTISPECIES: ATP-binding cassette domain-containing protein [Streptomyces]SED52057.1 ABC-2 type transport system ATP-binding protein [Streptomyces misionensis]SFY53526.1 ABC transporter ATP-binding protein NatA [Streptomyces sp. F-1]
MTDVVDIEGLTKRYGEVTAVEDVSFQVRPGRVVGLLGRNGAGKTTTLRMLLGLARPTAGRATVFGHPYAQLPRAAHRVGVGMDGIGPSNAATGRGDLNIWAKTLGLGRSRVEEVLERVGLADDAHRKLRGFSTGMRQRHALATALLADPELLILDEPANGLDPDGIRWLRQFLRSLADEGRTVLLSSHLLAEVEQTADDIVILQRTLRYSGTVADLTRNGTVSLESSFFDLVGPAAKEPSHA